MLNEGRPRKRDWTAGPVCQRIVKRRARGDSGRTLEFRGLGARRVTIGRISKAHYRVSQVSPIGCTTPALTVARLGAVDQFDSKRSPQAAHRLCSADHLATAGSRGPVVQAANGQSRPDSRLRVLQMRRFCAQVTEAMQFLTINCVENGLSLRGRMGLYPATCAHSSSRTKGCSATSWQRCASCISTSSK